MSRQIVVGRIVGVFGVRGWVKVRSETEPPENILSYSPWQVGDAGEMRVVDGKCHGSVIVARLAGITDRDQALRLQGAWISVPRSRFGETKRGEFYWVDLIGLEVRTDDGRVLGQVSDMMATGANDVMEVRGDRTRLIPFVVGAYVKAVALDEGYLIVDWDPDF